MTLDAVVDNDVLIKAACYRLLAEIHDLLKEGGDVGVLGAARFVVRKRLQRHPGIRSSAGALQCWADFLLVADELEPTKAEVELATSIEEAASRLGVMLDSGESQLCAIAICRSQPILVTGDKRAIQGMSAISGQVVEILQLCNRVMCLEQILKTVASHLGAALSRVQICAEPDVDRAISICFECSSYSEDPEFQPIGLESYINDLISSAPTMLVGSDNQG
jgi:hypothetical protein